MADPVLLPCPFCGGEMMFRGALWPSEGDRDMVLHSAPTDCPLGVFEDGTADESIIGRWNTRAQLARAEKVIEAAKVVLAQYDPQLFGDSEAELQRALAEYDRPSAPLDGRENG